MKNIEFINAGAGSGKTYTLVSLLADYLSGKLGKYKPGEIILTTFTDLASAEFREKARESLLKAGMYEEASQLETAAIGTVHAVAYGFVKQYWYLLGRGASDNVMSDNDKQFYISQSLADLAADEDILFFDDLFREFGFSRYEEDRNSENPDYWLDHLKSIIEKMEQYDIEDLKISREKSKAIVDRIFDSKKGIDENSANKVFKEYIEICGDKARREKIEKAINANPLRYSNLFDLATLEAKDNERKLLPSIDATVAAVAAEIRAREYGDKLKGYIDRTFDLAQKWKNKFNDYKAKNRLIDYNDMERLFLELLNTPSVADEIKGRYKIVFVDEFQDSSPIQVKIFDRLSEMAEKSIWVGDPKQAIYGFRGSDALLIKAVADVFNAGDDGKNLRKGKTLDTSYRSRKGLVELSNCVFIRAFSDIDPEDVALKVYRNDAEDFQNKTVKELIHWHLKKDPAKTRETNADHCQNLAQQIVKLLQSDIQVYDKSLKSIRPIQPEDIVILGRTNAQVNEITRTLKEYGLKTAGQSVNSAFLETAEVKLFLAILNYMQNYSNDLAKAEILHLCDINNYSVPGIIKSRLKYMPERNEALETKKTSENPDEIVIPQWEKGNVLIKKIDETTNQIRHLPVPDMAESLIIQLDLKTLVSRWGDTDRRIHNLEILLKHSLDYDERCLELGLGASLNNFIVYLASLGAQEEKPEKIKGAVNVLTYHKAKGLEWNVVVMESLDYDELKDDELIRKSFFGVSDVVNKLPSGDNLFPIRHIQLLPWFPGAKKTVTADIKTVIAESDEFKNIETKVREDIKRLMYVGVTRARDYLITASYHKASLTWLKYIGCNEIVPQNCCEKDIDLWSTGFRSEFCACDKDPEFNGIVKEWNERSLIKKPVTDKYEPRYISPSKVQESLKIKIELIKDFNHRIAISAEKNNLGESPSDAQTGTCLHDIFCVFQYGSEKNQEKAQRILQNRLMQSTFPEPARIIKSMDNLYGFLLEKYGAPVKMHKELPMQMFTKDEQIVRGSCDLVLETKEGYVLIDYKSFQGGINQITAPDNEHFAGIYAPQLNTYRKVLEANGGKVIASLIYYAAIGMLISLNSD